MGITYIQPWQEMRIPSQFTEDSLYGRKKLGRDRRGNSDSRRVIHMVVALVLVLVMMQQASKPQIYESFFGAMTSNNQAALAGSSTQIAQVAQADVSVEIDPAVTDQVVDGSVWRSGDFDALYLFLANADQVALDRGPVVGVLPLLQQPDIFRNKVVRSRGRVVRSERIAAAANEQSIDSYWQLWLRPADGTERPLVAIVKSVPDSVASVGIRSTNRDGPDVQIVGRFLKRLAYRSGKGADLAPVIVGRLETLPTMDAKQPAMAESKLTHRTQLWLILAFASVIGIGLAAMAMLRTATAARRVRKIRGDRYDRSVLSLQSLRLADSTQDSSANGPES